MDGRRVALALGSGGARGYAHIGVIGELGDRGYEIAGVAGSSMGALVGGLHAAGSLDGFTQWARTLSQSAVLRLLDPAWRGPGFFRAEKVLDVVRELLGEVAIETLPIPFTAVTTDLIAGKSLWLQRGPLDVAIRASIAMPGMIAPYIADGRVLADGGVLDPLPVGPLAGANADVTIAVSLSGGDSDGTRYRPPDSEPTAALEWFNRLVRNTSALLETPTARSVLSRFGATVDDEIAEEPPDPDGDVEAAGSAADGDVEAAGSAADGDVEAAGSAADGVVEAAGSASGPKLGSFEVMNRTIDVMQSALARHQLAAYPPDVLIEVPRSSSRSLDFHRAAEMIDLGRTLAAAALDSYEAQYASRDEQSAPDGDTRDRR